jgi:hypothetical protein
MFIGAPFGGLVLLAVVGCALVVGLALLASALPGGPRGRARGKTGALVLAGGAALVLLPAACDAVFGVDEWNPAGVRPAAVVGVWRDGAARLELRADGTYELRARGQPVGGVEASSGRWTLFDWNVQLADTAGGLAPTRLKVVIARGQYRILESPGDPDNWDGRLGFRREPPARPR